MTTESISDESFMTSAFEQALKSYREGGLPIGAVLVRDGKIIGRGHNRRVQDGNPIAHGEMNCLQNAGRMRRYTDTTLYTTLSPCMMCAGTILQFGIPKVVIGENENFGGNEGFLERHYVSTIVLDDGRCKELMSKFIQERPELWDEDIAGVKNVEPMERKESTSPDP